MDGQDRSNGTPFDKERGRTHDRRPEMSSRSGAPQPSPAIRLIRELDCVIESLDAEINRLRRQLSTARRLSGGESEPEIVAFREAFESGGHPTGKPFPPEEGRLDSAA